MRFFSLQFKRNDISGVEAPRNSLESITEEDKDDHLGIAVSHFTSELIFK